MGVDVTGSELGRTQMGGVGLQAQQGLVRALAPVAGIVSDLGTFLTPKDGEHGTVEIEDQSGSLVGKVHEELQQSLIRTCQLLSEAGGGPKQKASQGLRVGGGGQARKGLERPRWTEERVGFHASQ